MTFARPDRKRGRLNVVRGMSAVAAVALTLAVPRQAAAAPAPCERAEQYAAQSGAELLHVDRLEGADYGRVSNAGLAEAKSALVADATVNSAAVARLLDADQGGDITHPLIQQAPPTNPTGTRQPTDAGEVGPFAFGNGSLTSHAQWDPRMACGRAAGEVTRADAAVRDVGVGELIRLGQKVRSRSTTALAAGGRTVAAAAINLTQFDLLDGAVHVKVVRPPTLTARMSIKDGGEVRYVPAAVELSGNGIRTTRLSAAGAEVELALTDETDTRAESSTVEELAGGPPLPLPAVRGLPGLGGEEESAPARGPGTRLRITLGKVRQAAAGHAIAAKATAIRITITKAPADDAKADDRAGAAESGPDGYGGTAPDRDRAVLDLGIGLLEAAAVAPEFRSGGVQGKAAGGVSAVGAGAGLPITGSPVATVAIGGAGLVISGAAALVYATRRRRIRR
jgi:hypothetical protein